jgi:hypothetical protein
MHTVIPICYFSTESDEDDTEIGPSALIGDFESSRDHEGQFSRGL